MDLCGYYKEVEKLALSYPSLSASIFFSSLLSLKGAFSTVWNSNSKLGSWSIFVGSPDSSMYTKSFRSPLDKCSTRPAPYESPRTLTAVRKRSLKIEIEPRQKIVLIVSKQKGTEQPAQSPNLFRTLNHPLVCILAVHKTRIISIF